MREVRPDLRHAEVATLAAGILPFVNVYPQQQFVGLPDPELVVRLVRAFVLGDEAPSISLSISK